VKEKVKSTFILNIRPQGVWHSSLSRNIENNNEFDDCK